MTRRLLSISALASILLAGLSAAPALALNEADRLWLVGERAFADGLHPIARRALDRFVVEYPNDTRIAPAMLILGRTRLVLGEPEKALEVLRRLRARHIPSRVLVLTARSEVTDRILILGQHHLRRTLGEYARHYSGHSKHRALRLQSPRSDRPVIDLTHERIKRRPVLGGLITEYERAA